MTPSRLSEMAPHWIIRVVKLELVASNLDIFHGPRFDTLNHCDNTLVYACVPWYFPRELTLTHIDWIDMMDDSRFHRTYLDPKLCGTSEDCVVIKGKLMFTPVIPYIVDVI